MNPLGGLKIFIGIFIFGTLGKKFIGRGFGFIGCEGIF
jgi:hypothetical protein